MKKYLVAAAAVLCVPGAAYAGDFDGPRAEARIGWETPTVSEDGDVFKIESDVSYGGEVGFDLAVGKKVVVGPYATYEFSNVGICDGADCLNEDGNLGIGGRLGIAVGKSALIYGKLGYARIRFTATAGGVTDSASDSGVQGALGLNLNFGKNAYGMLEVNYGDYGKFEGINLQRRHVVAGIGLRL